MGLLQRMPPASVLLLLLCLLLGLVGVTTGGAQQLLLLLLLLLLQCVAACHPLPYLSCLSPVRCPLSTPVRMRCPEPPVAF
jgi:hypothetical protein